MLDVFIILISILIIALIMEGLDMIKAKNLTDCKNISNYCTDHGQYNNIKYVIREPINSNESIDLLLSKIEDESSRMDKIIYWRVSLITATTICLFYLFYNKLGNINVPLNSYLFLLITAWFLNYWMRNHLDFHYHDLTHLRIKESIAQIRKNIK